MTTNQNDQGLNGQFLTKYCMHLNKLKILKVKSEQLQLIFVKEYLEQKGQFIQELNVNETQTQQFTHLCPNLTVIDSQIQGSAQSILDKGINSQIQSLELEGNFASECFQFCLQGKYDKLSTVSIQSCASFSDQNLQILLQNANNIQSLKLKSLIQLTNSSLRQIANYGYNYQQISLIDLDQITQETLVFIFQECKNVKQVELDLLSQIDAEIFKVMKQNNLYLQGLQLRNLILQGNENWIDEILQISQLNYLKLNSLNLNALCAAKILQHGKRLQTLDLCENQISIITFPINDENNQPYPIYKSLKILKVTFQNYFIQEQFKKLKEKYQKIKILNKDQEIFAVNKDFDFIL